MKISAQICIITYTILSLSSEYISFTQSFYLDSSLQRRREWERSPGQIVQSLLAMSRWIPAIAEMPRDAGVRSKVAEVRRPAHRRL